MGVCQNRRVVFLGTNLKPGMAATTPPDRDDETGAEFDGLPETDGTDAETICGEPTDDGSPCQRETESGEPCFMHGEDGPPADHGAPEGNQNGDDNAGGGAPEGNDNAFKHGFHTATSRRMELFDDDQLAAFGDYYTEFIVKVETESAAARLASLAVIADELEADIIQNGVFREVLDIGDGTGDEGRAAGRSPRDETLNALLRVLRELRLGKDAEGVTGNDMSDATRFKTQFTHLMNTNVEENDAAWRNGTESLLRIDASQIGQQRERPPSPPGRGDFPDELPDEPF
jgi:hypothetical protein